MLSILPHMSDYEAGVSFCLQDAEDSVFIPAGSKQTQEDGHVDK